MSTTESWVPDACTLPTIEHPLRHREWEEFLANGLRTHIRISPTRLRWTFDPRVEADARDLARRETECCSFFAFDFESTGGGLQVEVAVPPAYVPVLDALADQAQAQAH